jgi:hypothetical protein
MTSWDNHMNAKYDEPGTGTREEWERTFEVFKLRVCKKMPGIEIIHRLTYHLSHQKLI